MGKSKPPQQDNMVCLSPAICRATSHRPGSLPAIACRDRAARKASGKAMGVVSKRQSSQILVAEVATSLDFANYAQSLRQFARKKGLITPSFKSPPPPGMPRAISWAEGMSHMPRIQVRIARRTRHEVAQDMVDGLLFVNDIQKGDPRHKKLAEALMKRLNP